MVATKIAPTTRFFAPEISKIYYLPVIASASLIPTRAELNAGKDLSDEIAGIDGWLVESGFIDVPDMGTRFTSQIPGRTSASGSSIDFHASRDGNDIRKVLPRDTAGFIWIADGGDVAANFADIFPITVASLGKMRTIDNSNLRIKANFTITRKPVEDVVIPAQV